MKRRGLSVSELFLRSRTSSRTTSKVLACARANAASTCWLVNCASNSARSHWRGFWCLESWRGDPKQSTTSRGHVPVSPCLACRLAKPASASSATGIPWISLAMRNDSRQTCSASASFPSAKILQPISASTRATHQLPPSSVNMSRLLRNMITACWCLPCACATTPSPR